ncbi:transcription antitermination protein [Haloarcula sp. S1CR25-12]|uniref:Transcription antitermination protein n=1 Tax=Haloarcula saliterrae TaxID=2950534 RepID=A0ABU2FEH7_9EURY|nr:transcription antitermination protein [Haloarcula sp. S1CR25-12]MDS0260663.1 transcription antitermination protein [Haloarcula sp. S1CR25-12]
MDAADTIAAVEDGTTTERSRLGSDKTLVAATDATLETDAVWRAAATREAGVAGALDGWAGETDGAVAEAFERAAAAAGDRADRIDATPDDADALSAYLRTLDGTADRVGAGLVAVPLALDRFYLQVVSFFVNEADESRADVARELRTGASDLDPARAALSALDDSGRERARDAAIEALGVAYDEYAETLEAMGFDPKPIC